MEEHILSSGCATVSRVSDCLSSNPAVQSHHRQSCIHRDNQSPDAWLLLRNRAVCSEYMQETMPCTGCPASYPHSLRSAPVRPMSGVPAKLLSGLAVPVSAPKTGQSCFPAPASWELPAVSAWVPPGLRLSLRPYTPVPGAGVSPGLKIVFPSTTIFLEA